MQRKFIEIMLHHENQNELLVYFIKDNTLVFYRKTSILHTLVLSKQWTQNSNKRRCMSYRKNKKKTTRNHNNHFIQFDTSPSLKKNAKNGPFL